MRLLSKLLPSVVLFLNANLISEETKEFFLHEMTHQDFVEVFDNHAPSAIIKIEEGTKLPIILSTNSNIFSIEVSENATANLVIEKLLYIKVTHTTQGADCSLCEGSSEEEEPTSEMLFSQDQVTWKSFEDMFSGHIFTGVSTDEQNPYPTAKLSLGLEFRD
jgi:hypothetical protein